MVRFYKLYVPVFFHSIQILHSIYESAFFVSFGIQCSIIYSFLIRTIMVDLQPHATLSTQKQLKISVYLPMYSYETRFAWHLIWKLSVYKTYWNYNMYQVKSEFFFLQAWYFLCIYLKFYSTNIMNMTLVWYALNLGMHESLLCSSHSHIFEEMSSTSMLIIYIKNKYIYALHFEKWVHRLSASPLFLLLKASVLTNDPCLGLWRVPRGEGEGGV